MATSILERFGTEVKELTMIPSSGGVYEIWKNDKIVFSKRSEGRFPNSDAEVIDAL